MILRHPSADQLRDRRCCPAQAEPDITCFLNGVAYPPSNRKLTYMPQRLDRLSSNLSISVTETLHPQLNPATHINMSAPPAKTDAIIIVGAGIFGLSTAIHLARRGYINVTVFDKQPYEKTLYSYTEGCDAASAGSCCIIHITIAGTDNAQISTRSFAPHMELKPSIRTSAPKLSRLGMPGMQSLKLAARQSRLA